MVSVIIPCKNRLNHLSFTFPLTQRLDGEYEIVIVDYRCPMGTADYFRTKFADCKQLVVVNAEVGEKDWNLAHSRNLGYKASRGEALLFIDADTKVKPNFLTSHSLPQGEFYTGSWLHASGCCYVWRSDFEAVKGYNEVCEGWGTEDYCLYKRLEARGVRRRYFNEKLLRNLPHHDKIRNEYHGGANIHTTNERNFQRTQKEFRSILE